MRYFSFFVVIFFLTSCSQKNNPVAVDIQEENIFSLKPDKLDTLMYSDLYCDVEFVPLECDASLPFGEISDLKITQSADFIVFDIIQKGIFRFDSTGHFLNNIGQCGHANQEYIEPLGIAYDKYNNKVLVNDNAKQRIVRYNLDGTFCDEIKLDFYFNAFGVIDSTHIALFLDYYWQNNRKEDYNFKVVDLSGKVIYEAFPYSFVKNQIHHDCKHVFEDSDYGLLFLQPGTSVLYKVTSNSLVPMYFVNYSDEDLIKQDTAVRCPVFNQKISESKYQIHSIFLVNGKFLSNVVDERKFYFWVQDIKNKDIHFFSTFGFLHNDLKGSITNYFIKTTSGGNIYYVIEPDDIPLIVQNEEMSCKNKEFVDLLSKHTNPIIQICTLK